MPLRLALFLTAVLALPACAQPAPTPAGGETMVLTQGNVPIPLSQLRVVPQGSTTPMPLAAALASTGLPTNTTIAGLPAASNPSAAALAAQVAPALPVVTTTSAGVLPALPGGTASYLRSDGTFVTPPSATPATTVLAGLVKVPAASGLGVAVDGTLSNLSLLQATSALMAANGSVARPLTSVVSEVFNARNYGLIGTGAITTIGSTYGTSPAALASYTVNGQQPFAWATNPLFGLTFTMTASSNQAAANAASPLTFAQAAITAGNLPWRSTGLAQWASPEHAYEYVRVGMLASGTNIPAGATIGAIETAPVRMSELLPNCIDWTPNTAYAANQCVEFSGVAAWANAAGSSGGGTAFPIPNTSNNYTTLVTGQTSGTVTDGSVTWTIKQQVEYIQWPTGRITLANDSGQTTAVATGTVVTFTESPAQIAAHTVDWLALQAAVGNAWLYQGMGAEAHFSACKCMIDRPIFNPGVTNTGSVTPNVAIRGDGQDLTAIYQTQNFGYGNAAISESNLTQPSVSSYSDFSLRGSTGDPGIFGFTAYTNNGIQVGADARLYRLHVTDNYCGVAMDNDHQEYHGVVANNNYLNMCMLPYETTMGNQYWEGGSVDGARSASFGISYTNQIDASTILNDPIGFAPYGFYGLPPTPDMTAPNGALLSNSVLFGDNTEAVGEEWARGSSPNAILNQNVLVATGGYGFGYPGAAISNPTGGTVQPQGLTYLSAYTGNTMLLTQQGAIDYYGTNPSQGVIVTYGTNGGQGTCNNNTWRDDPYIIGQQGYPNIPALVCPNGMNNDVFSSSQGDGYFAVAFGNLTAGELLSRFYIVSVEQYSDNDGNNSGGFAGVAAETMATNLAVAVINKSAKIVVPQANTAITLNSGVPVFATSTPSVGVDAGVDKTGAIGTISFCGSSGVPAGQCAISLDPGVTNGAHGANTGVSAAGTTAGTATALTSLTNVITSATSGSATGILLPSALPVGACVRASNATAVQLNEYPPSGWTIGLGTLASLPIPAAASGQNGSAIHCRIGATAYD